MIWAMIVALLVVAYFLFRIKKKKKTVSIDSLRGDVYDQVCPHCGSMMKKNDRYCPNCLKENK